MFLNHYLDITDAISDGQNEMIDDTDLQGTDFPTNVPLPQTMYVDEERHEQVREWILTNAMDRDASQVNETCAPLYEIFCDYREHVRIKDIPLSNKFFTTKKVYKQHIIYICTYTPSSILTAQDNQTSGHLTDRSLNGRH